MLLRGSQNTNQSTSPAVFLWNPHCGILGQPAVEGSVPVGFVERCGSDYPDVSEVQMNPKPSKIGAGTHSSFGESGLVLDTSQGPSVIRET